MPLRYKTVKKTMYRRKKMMKKPNPKKSLTFRYTSPTYPIRIRRTAVIDSFSSIGGSEVNKAYSFNLAQLPGVGDFTPLFDSYRIDRVVVKFWPFKADNMDTGGVSTYDVPRTFAIVDYDDENTLTSSQIREYNNCRSGIMTKPLRISLVPKVAQTVYRTALTSAYATPRYPIKLDMAYTDVPHYGIKYANTTSATSGGFGYEVQVQFYCSFFGAR